MNYHVGFLRPDGRIDEDTPIDLIVQHARYIADRIGVEHLALGSDYDGATIPKDLNGVDGLPKLMDALAAAGFDDPSLRLIAHENWLRILEATWS